MTNVRTRLTTLFAVLGVPTNRIRAVLVAAATISTVIPLLMTQTASAASFTPMDHYGASGYCIDDPDNSTTNGELIQLWQCNGNPQQSLTAASSPYATNAYELRFANGKCIDDPGDSNHDGTRLQIWSCLGNENQAWFLSDIGFDGAPDYWGNPNGMAIDDYNDQNSDGNKIQVWSSLSNGSQQWCGPDYCQFGE
jgi:hypothetical protein